MPVTLHPLMAADFAVADLILTTVYERPHSMLAVLRSYHQMQPDGWLLARCDGVPAGTGGVILYGDLARIGLIATHPDFQRRGIGLAIMEHLLAWARDRGATTVRLDASPAGAPLYARLGFVTDDLVRGYRWTSSAAPVEPMADGVAPFRPADLPEVIAFDAERFGASRAVVLTQYADEFAERAFVARDDRGRVTGYLIAQTAMLGPWLAETPEVAAALLRRALPLCSADMQAFVPEHNQAALALVERAGFTCMRRLSSMRLGGHAELERRQWIYGYANFYLG